MVDSTPRLSSRIVSDPPVLAAIEVLLQLNDHNREQRFGPLVLVPYADFNAGGIC